MKIAVVGSREFGNMKFAEKMIMHIFTKEMDYRSDTPILISGGARGIDKLAEKVVNDINTHMAYSYKIDKVIFQADWDKYGKSAGFIRNKLIIDEADFVLAFWDGESKGTWHSIDLARKAGKSINIYVRK